MPPSFKDIGNFDKKEEEFCCDSPKISEELGFYVCLNCGLVYDRILDDSPRRAFTQEETEE
jgi:transcription initiation factor TFIIIB Brf1 subunit/transcription initiation factor TFIIB